MSNLLRTLRSRLLRSSAIAVLGLVAATGCSVDRAVGPSVEVNASHGLISGTLGAVTSTVNRLVNGQALLRTTPLTRSISRSITVSSSGGVINIPEAGVSLTIPARAIGNRTMTITMTAMAGNAVAYTFEPHGVQFQAGLTLTQDLTQTTWHGNIARIGLGGGYFANDNQVNTTTGAAQLNELLPAIVIGNRVTMNLWHFSGYMVSMD